MSAPTTTRKGFLNERQQVGAAADASHWKLADVTTTSNDRYDIHTYVPDGKAVRSPEQHLVTVTYQRSTDTVIRVRRQGESAFASEALRAECGGVEGISAFEFVAPAFWPLSA